MKALALGLSAAVCAISALGCAPEHGLTYHILIDPSLSPTQAEDVMAGGDAWVQAVPGLALDYTITPCNGYGSWTHTICIFLDPSDPPSETIDGQNLQVTAKTVWSSVFLESPTSAEADSATIHLYSQVILGIQEPYEFRNVAAHELTHAFCHDGTHIGPGNLMYAETTGKVVIDITANDIQYFWNAR